MIDFPIRVFPLVRVSNLGSRIVLPVVVVDDDFDNVVVVHLFSAGGCFKFILLLGFPRPCFRMLAGIFLQATYK